MQKYLYILAALALTALSSCFKGDYQDPPAYSDANLPVNKTITELKKWFAEDNLNSEPKTITEDWTIEGVVTSSDQTGNIYKQIYIQDATGGICLSVDMNNTYASYPQGRKIYVKLQGLTLGTYGGLVQVGYEIDEQYSPAGVFRMPPSIVDKHIFFGDFLGMPEPILITDFSSLTDSLQSMFILLEEVEIPDAELGKTYADAVAQQTKNRTLGNCSGQKVTLRNSGFASFAGVEMPKGKGNAQGIFTVFNGTLQLLISDTTDMAGLTGFRCDGSDPNASYLLDENFESSSSNSSLNNLNGWTTYIEAGTKDWVGGSFSGNKFAKISAFNSSNPSVISWLISPEIDLSTVSSATLNFQTLEGYDNGASLKLKYSTNYSGSGNPSSATWQDLSATIAAGTSTGYNPNWTPSGDIDLSAMTGSKIYLAWVYDGSDPSRTTTFELDNVKLRGE